jgi:hypothetical protein
MVLMVLMMLMMLMKPVYDSLRWVTISNNNSAAAGLNYVC